MNKLLAFCPLLVSLFGCQQSQPSDIETKELPYYQEASFTPHWDVDDIEALHAIPSFSLTNQYGQSITEKSMEGKISIVDYFFTTCTGICPDMSKNMANLQTAFALDDQVQLISHSVTPAEDSVSVLKAYAEYYGALPGKWHFLTGDVRTIYDLGRQSYFVEENLGLEKDPGDFLHTENFVLIDQNRHIRGIYNGLNKTDMALLIQDVKVLL